LNSLRKHVCGGIQSFRARIGELQEASAGPVARHGERRARFSIQRERLRRELLHIGDRLGVDATVYHKRTQNQIVQNLRESYGTGFILFNLNGASTENKGAEISVRGTPVQHRDLSWDFIVNFAKAKGKTVSLPNAIAVASRARASASRSSRS